MSKSISESVRNILDEAEKTIIIPPGEVDPAPGKICPSHHGMALATSKLIDTQIHIAEGLDRLESALSEVFRLLRQADKNGAVSETKIAVLENTIGVDARRKLVVLAGALAFGSSLLTGLVVAAVGYAIK